MSLIMLCFPCCVEEQPPPRRRPKIDRTMIGAPTNFQHTGHIGSGDMSTGFDVGNVQTQMKSKGGYENDSSIAATAGQNNHNSRNDGNDHDRPHQQQL